MSAIKDFFVPQPKTVSEPPLTLGPDMEVRGRRVGGVNPPQDPRPRRRRRFTFQQWHLHQIVSFRPDNKGALPMQANQIQVGGDHYNKHEIQPWDAVTSWGLGFLDGNAVKYLARWRHKNGLQDLRKAQHYISKLIEQEENRLREAGEVIPPHVSPDGTPLPPGTQPEPDPEPEPAPAPETLSPEQEAEDAELEDEADRLAEILTSGTDREAAAKPVKMKGAPPNPRKAAAKPRQRVKATAG